MAFRDYSEDDDYYEQGFYHEGLVSVWLGLGGDQGEADVMQDLCGVGYYDLSDQEIYHFDFKLVPVRDLLEPISFSQSFIDEVIAAATKKGIENARWIAVQFNFEYDPSKVKREIADDPIYVGSFPFIVDLSD